MPKQQSHHHCSASYARNKESVTNQLLVAQFQFQMDTYAQETLKLRDDGIKKWVQNKAGINLKYQHSLQECPVKHLCT
jgi:hypothetical protein